MAVLRVRIEKVVLAANNLHRCAALCCAVLRCDEQIATCRRKKFDRRSISPYAMHRPRQADEPTCCKNTVPYFIYLKGLRRRRKKNFSQDPHHVHSRSPLWASWFTFGKNCEFAVLFVSAFHFLVPSEKKPIAYDLCVIGFPFFFLNNQQEQHNSFLAAVLFCFSELQTIEHYIIYLCIYSLRLCWVLLVGWREDGEEQAELSCAWRLA